MDRPPTEPMILSPNYDATGKKKKNTTAADWNSTTTTTIVLEQQCEDTRMVMGEQDPQVLEEYWVRLPPPPQQNRRRYDPRQDTWIAGIAFLGVLVISVGVAMIMDPSSSSSSSSVDPEEPWWTRIVVSVMTWIPSLPNVQSTVPSPPPSSQLPCFRDYPIRNNIQVEEDFGMDRISMAPHCSSSSSSSSAADDTTTRGTTTWTACPRGGHCVGGYLKLCYDNYLQVSLDGTCCIFTQQAQQDVDAIIDLLTQYTIEYMCVGPQRAQNPCYAQDLVSSQLLQSTGTTNDSVMMDPLDHHYQSSPLFFFRSITDTLQIPYNPKLLLHTQHRPQFDHDHTGDGGDNDVFIFERNEKDGSILIGLHPSQTIELPWGCYMKKMILSIVTTLVVWIWTAVIVIGSWILSYFMESPILSIFVTSTGLLSYMTIRMIQQRRRVQRQLEYDIVQLRERVYDELCKDRRTAVPAQVICDRIAWNVYPTSYPQRYRIHHILYPFVVRDIESDRRVIKSWSTANNSNSTTTSPNIPELCWQWVDPQPHSSNPKSTPQVEPKFR
jgi:hypothetical protein